MNPSDGSKSDAVGESNACFSAGGSLGDSVADASPSSEVSSVSTEGTQSSSFCCEVGSSFTVSVNSLSFSEGGLVLVGVHSPSLAERPLKPSSSGPPGTPQVEPSLSPPRSFWWIR